MSPGECFGIIIAPPQQFRVKKATKKKGGGGVRHCIYQIHRTEISYMYVY